MSLDDIKKAQDNVQDPEDLEEEDFDEEESESGDAFFDDDEEDDDEEDEDDEEWDEDDEDEDDDEDWDEDDEEEEDDNPLSYRKVQRTTDDLNGIYRDGAAVARELKGAYDDIKKLMDFKSMFKF